jgi:hypothetical protein
MAHFFAILTRCSSSLLFCFAATYFFQLKTKKQCAAGLNSSPAKNVTAKTRAGRGVRGWTGCVRSVFFLFLLYMTNPENNNLTDGDLVSDSVRVFFKSPVDSRIILFELVGRVLLRMVRQAVDKD